MVPYLRRLLPDDPAQSLYRRSSLENVNNASCNFISHFGNQLIHLRASCKHTHLVFLTACRVLHRVSRILGNGDRKWEWEAGTEIT